jgi:hypothetical protein
MMALVAGLGVEIKRKLSSANNHIQTIHPAYTS